jgi:hypothetical protein
VDVRPAVPTLPIHLNEVFALTHPSIGRSVCRLLTANQHGLSNPLWGITYT